MVALDGFDSTDDTQLVVKSYASVHKKHTYAVYCYCSRTHTHINEKHTFTRLIHTCIPMNKE